MNIPEIQYFAGGKTPYCYLKGSVVPSGLFLRENDPVGEHPKGTSYRARRAFLVDGGS
jgi:hypothetical protein